jgi:hypothetical protein
MQVFCYKINLIMCNVAGVETRKWRDETVENKYENNYLAEPQRL